MVMERDTKRKAGDASPDSQARPSKRQKVPGNHENEVETAESTTEVGLRFVESLKQARDKHGRNIATHFLTLPSKDDFPEYYEEILLPIAINTVETKLKNREYPNLAAVESDIKRMVNNAKAFNDRKSLIYEDAERVRKMASNFMTKHNPAYQDPSYIALPTPLPTEVENSVPDGQVPEKGPTTITIKGPQSKTQGSHRRSLSDRARRKESEEPAPAIDEEEAGSEEFAGLSFQEAQDRIISDLLKFQDESGLEIFTPFANLPSRSLTDYYATIKHPMSLKGVLKKVRGVHGRNQPTGVTDFKSWDAFESEVSLIWRNAREYNEDGSEMFNLANELEEHFRRKLSQAKSKVDEPPQPTLKLKMSAPKPSIKIRFGGQKESPTPGASADASSVEPTSATPGVIVDSKALERQQQHVEAGINGQRPSTGDSTTQENASRSEVASRRSASAGSPPAMTNGVKTEAQSGQSPALNAIRPSSAGIEQLKEGQRLDRNSQAPQNTASSAMPPPAGPLRPASGSPHPSQQPGQANQSTNHSHQPAQYTPPTGLETKLRGPDKTVADAILPLLTVSTHPALNLARPFSLSIPASPTVTQQSRTLTLPTTHHYLQITPTLPAELLVRPYRLFVTVNGQRMMEVARFGHERDKSRPLFEARLVQGVNRIEVELVAGAVKGAGKAGSEQVETEKVTLFAHVLRS